MCTLQYPEGRALRASSDAFRLLEASYKRDHSTRNGTIHHTYYQDLQVLSAAVTVLQGGIGYEGSQWKPQRRVSSNFVAAASLLCLHPAAAIAAVNIIPSESCPHPRSGRGCQGKRGSGDGSPRVFATCKACETQQRHQRTNFLELDEQFACEHNPGFILLILATFCIAD